MATINMRGYFKLFVVGKIPVGLTMDRGILAIDFIE
jgi:hypothetical protein